MDHPVKPEDDLGGMGAIFLDPGSGAGMTKENNKALSLRPGLDPVRGFRVQGIIGPVMLGVAPLEFLFYGRITVAPEAGQIPGFVLYFS